MMVEGELRDHLLLADALIEIFQHCSRYIRFALWPSFKQYRTSVGRSKWDPIPMKLSQHVGNCHCCGSGPRFLLFSSFYDMRSILAYLSFSVVHAACSYFE
jgi:hypothetical protein